MTAKAAGHSNSDATSVGVGVGVPLGLLLLLSLVLAAWTERRRRRDVERVVRETGRSGGQWDREKSHARLQTQGVNVLPHEVEVGDRRMPELGHREVHEAGGMYR